MVSFIALIAGIIFGLGIIASGMVNPALVLAFLDVADRDECFSDCAYAHPVFLWIP